MYVKSPACVQASAIPKKLYANVYNEDGRGKRGSGERRSREKDYVIGLSAWRL